MTTTPDVQLTSMIALTSFMHRWQIDKGGAPYILHCLEVMRGMPEDDYELMAIAVGHDLVEDTRVSAADLLRAGYSERVVAGIMGVTKVKGETPKQYLKKVLVNKDSCMVKKADLLHNMDTSRLKEITDKDRKRNLKYKEMFTIVNKMLSTHEELEARGISAAILRSALEDCADGMLTACGY